MRTAELESLSLQPAALILVPRVQEIPLDLLGCAEGADRATSASPEIYLAQRRYEEEDAWDKDEDWVDDPEEEEEEDEDDYDDAEDEDYDDDYDDDEEDEDEDYDDDESSDDWDDDYDEDDEEEEED